MPPPGVTAADYINNKAVTDPFSGKCAEYKLKPMKSFTRPVVGRQSCDIILGDFAIFVIQQQTCLKIHNTQYRLAAHVIGQEGCCLSVFKLGQIFALFSRITQA